MPFLKPLTRLQSRDHNLLWLPWTAQEGEDRLFSTLARLRLPAQGRCYPESQEVLERLTKRKFGPRRPPLAPTWLPPLSGRRYGKVQSPDSTSITHGPQRRVQEVEGAGSEQSRPQQEGQCRRGRGRPCTTPEHARAVFHHQFLRRPHPPPRRGEAPCALPGRPPGTQVITGPL